MFKPLLSLVYVRPFFSRYNEKVPLSLEEAQIKAHLTIKKLRKRPYLLQEGDVCKTIAFVEKGALRQYSNDHGMENIILFALEDAELVRITKSAHEELLQKQPKYEPMYGYS